MADRKKAERRGRRAETLAALALTLKGYTILARRVRLSVGEIDLIAKRGKLVAFIEVKARATHEAALEAVSHSSEQRIISAAEIWMSRRADLANHDWRFDIISVVPWRWPKHTPDAWRPEYRGP